MTGDFNTRPVLEETGMQWQEVDSSQITHIGYDAATSTLGIRFPAGKKSPASEYHYSNVSAETHQTFIEAESIGTYFGKNIESRADQYPYVKVETDLPFASPQTTQSNGNATSAMASTVGETTSSALALIDTMADDLLFTAGAVTDAQLTAGREWYLAEAKKYDISTEANRTKLKRFARPLQKLRTAIEARAKELTGATKRKIAAIDTEKRRLIMAVGGIEDEVLAPLTAWEQEEEARKNWLAAIVNEYAAAGQRFYTTSAELEAVINSLENANLASMQEYTIGAESAIMASLKVLKPELERRQIQEVNDQELRRLREEAAVRAEADRLANAAKVAREQAEQKTEIDRLRLEREKKDAVERAELAEKMRIADEQAASRRAEEAAAQAKRDIEAAVEAERKRAAEVATAEQEAMEARARVKEHREAIETEIYKVLVEHIPAAVAKKIIGMIADGHIPHITINY